jgi:hypothetical protein
MSRERQVQAIRGTVLDLIKRGATIQIVCLTSRPEFILGFVCYEQSADGPVIHYVYVKNGYRENGIASALLKDIASNAKVRTSHRTPLGDCLFKANQYNPRLSRYSAESRVTGDGREHPGS